MALADSIALQFSTISDFCMLYENIVYHPDSIVLFYLELIRLILHYLKTVQKSSTVSM